MEQPEYVCDMALCAAAHSHRVNMSDEIDLYAYRSFSCSGKLVYMAGAYLHAK